jgi:hypothetical protein
LHIEFDRVAKRTLLRSTVRQFLAACGLTSRPSIVGKGRRARRCSSGLLLASPWYHGQVCELSWCKPHVCGCCVQKRTLYEDVVSEAQAWQVAIVLQAEDGGRVCMSRPVWRLHRAVDPGWRWELSMCDVRVDVVALRLERGCEVLPSSEPTPRRTVCLDVNRRCVFPVQAGYSVDQKPHGKGGVRPPWL